jgi:hypothetical protein
MNEDNAPKELQIHPWGKEVEDLVKIPRDGENPVGGTETPVLGELISPKNSKIPRRNQWIANGGGSWGSPHGCSGVCEREKRGKQ